MVKRLYRYFTLGKCLFKPVKLSQNADLEKYRYSGCGNGFDLRSDILWPDGSKGKDIIIFGAESSSTHIGNKIKISQFLMMVWHKD